MIIQSCRLSAQIMRPQGVNGKIKLFGRNRVLALAETASGVLPSSKARMHKLTPPDPATINNGFEERINNAAT